MSTFSTDTLNGLAADWDNGMDYPSAVLSGIVGDPAHQRTGGYHISIEDQSSTNYSVVRVDDKAPPGTWPRNRAAAIDMSMSTADMAKCHNRLKTVFFNRHNDPRAKYINGFNGWDGNGSAGRYDMVTGSITTATDDHKWHEHLEIRRRYVNDPQMRIAVRSALRGETVQQYLGGDMAAVDEQSASYQALIWRVVALLDMTDQNPSSPFPMKNDLATSINSLLTSAAADEARDNAALVAIQAMAEQINALAIGGSGSFDTQAVLNAISNAGEAETARFQSILAELASTRAELTAARSELLEFREAKRLALQRGADALDSDPNT